MKQHKQREMVVTLVILVTDAQKSYIEEVEEHIGEQKPMQITRFVYGIPEGIYKDPEGHSIHVSPCSELLDPWMLTQDLKEHLEEIDNIKVDLPPSSTDKRTQKAINEFLEFIKKAKEEEDRRKKEKEGEGDGNI